MAGQDGWLVDELTVLGRKAMESAAGDQRQRFHLLDFSDSLEGNLSPQRDSDDACSKTAWLLRDFY